MNATKTTVMKLSLCPVHPLLIALYIPAFMLSKNMGLFDMEDTYRAIGLIVGVVLVVFIVCRWVYRDIHRAAFFTTALFAACFSFPLVRLFTGLASFAVISAATLGVAVLAFKMPANRSDISLVLNVFLVVMLVRPVYDVADAHFTGDGRASRAISDVDTPAQDVLLRARLPDVPPSVFHIILDGYSRDDVLRELYGYDNSPFTNRLREMGFFVANRATTPYGQTLLAVNSVLSMAYLNNYIQALESNDAYSSPDQLRRILRRFFQSAPVLRVFGEMGYRLVMIDSDYPALDYPRVDYFLTPETGFRALHLYELALINHTPFALVSRKLTSYLQGEHGRNTKLIFALDHHDYDAMEKPLFVFNHIVSPHPPFTIDHDGNPLDDDSWNLVDGSHLIEGDPTRRRIYRDGYVEKLRYTNRALIEHVQGLVEDVSGPKVIIIHGDHGGGMFLDQDDRSATCLKERFSPLLAVYATDPLLMESLVHNTNLVNLYRVLFNTQFGTDLPLLPARSFFVPWENPTKLKEIASEELTTLASSCEEMPSGSLASSLKWNGSRR